MGVRRSSLYATGALRPDPGTDFEAGKGRFDRGREKDQDVQSVPEDLPRSEIDEEAKMGLPQERK